MSLCFIKPERQEKGKGLNIKKRQGDKIGDDSHE
jgi:hypothetical protein